MIEFVLAVAAAAAVASSPAEQSGITLFPPEFFADAQPSTAMDMINRVPGFAFENSDNNIRGFGAAAGNVLIDGERPTSKSDNLDNAIRRIPASRVERIELIRGGAPGIDMQGKTVIANVIRKKGAAITGAIQVQNNFVYDGRNQPSWRLEATRKWGDRQLESSLVYGGFTEDQAGDGPRLRLDPLGNVLIASRYHVEGAFRNLNGSVAYEQGLAGGQIRIDTRLQRFKFVTDEENRLSFPVGREFSRNANHNDQGEVGLRYSRDFGTRLTTESVLLQQMKDQENEGVLLNATGQTLFGNKRTTGETVGRFVAIYRLTPKLSIQSGGEAAWNWLDSATRYSFNGAPIALPAANVKVQEKRGEAFALATWKASTKFNLEAGMRIEASRITSEGDVVLEKTLRYFKPRVSAVWSPSASNQFRFRVENEVGQLNFDDFVATSSLAIGYVTAGNPNLDPQRAWVMEAVYERRFWREGAFVVTFKHSALTDVVDRAPVFVPSGVYDAPGNIGDGTRDDLTANLTIPMDRFTAPGVLLKLRVNRRWSKVTDPTTGQQRPLSNLRPLEWGFSFSQDLPRWRANWGFDVNSKWRQRAFRFNEIERRGATASVFLYAEIRPRPSLSLRAELQQASGRSVDRTRQVYGTAGRLGPLAYTDRRDLEFGRMVQLRIRKTFG